VKRKSLWPSFLAGSILIPIALLTGCKGGQSTPTASNSNLGDTYTSQTLTQSYPGALNAASQLMLGILRLEGTDNAITSEQAKGMTSVLQSLQGQSLKADAERNAVLASVEAQLTPAQLSAIANMHPTQDDLQAWMRDNGQGAGVGPGSGEPAPRGTPGAPPAGGMAPPAMGTRQAPPGGAANGQPPMARGTSQPGGMPAGGQFAGGAGQSNILLNALIRLLASKSVGAATPTLIPTTLPLSTLTKP
jgi:hypothetical protein